MALNEKQWLKQQPEEYVACVMLIINVAAMIMITALRAAVINANDVS